MVSIAIGRYDNNNENVGKCGLVNIKNHPKAQLYLTKSYAAYLLSQVLLSSGQEYHARHTQPFHVIFKIKKERKKEKC